MCTRHRPLNGADSRDIDDDATLPFSDAEDFIPDEREQIIGRWPVDFDAPYREANIDDLQRDDLQ